MPTRSTACASLAGALALTVACAGATGCGGAAASAGAPPPRSPAPATATTAAAAPGAAARPAHHAARPAVQASRPPDGPPYDVRIETIRSVDPVRRLAGRPRSFTTVIRVPFAHGRPAGRFPLVVFGHGFNVTPTPYAPLLDAWARSGYVVAAPIFPLGNGDHPGGAIESDLPNQPRDMSLVIDELRGGPHVDERHIAVTGQSDGGDTALAAAEDPAVRDRRIAAVIVLSGAEDPFAARFVPVGGPPLLAVQGTADRINPPSDTHAFYDRTPPPKWLLVLDGAGHLPPYTEPGAALGAVTRTTLAFLDDVLKGQPAAFRRLVGRGGPGGPARLRPG